MKKAMIFTLVLGLTIGLTACSSATPQTVQVQTAQKNVITALSSEEVKVEPDIADIIYGVRTEAADAAGCQNQNTEEVNRVLEKLKEFGIEEKSIQTSAYGLNPKYDWSSDTQNIIGYEMNTDITISDIPIADLGEILTKSVEAGINSISYINYKSSKYDEHYQEALKLAIASAKRKAQTMAEAGECSVGKVANVTEYANQSSAARYSGYEENITFGSASADRAANVMPGELGIEASISVDFFIE